MLLALLALALVAAILLTSLVLRQASRRRVRRGVGERRPGLELKDPGRERRAEQRARELLRSCVNDEEWAMYRDLGFIRVWGRMGTSGQRRDRLPLSRRGEPQIERIGGAGVTRRGGDEFPYAYLVYPHKPIVAYVPSTRSLLNEYCVEFPDLTSAISSSRLPDSDDMLAKWMALTGDEERLIRNANMHLPGRQVDPARVRRDLWRLSEWERQRGDRRSFEAHNT